MLDRERIAARQFAIMTILYIIGSAILVIPSLLAAKAKQDAWIAAIAAVGIGMAFIPLYIALGKRFPDKNLAQYCEIILGKWLGKIAFLCFLIGFPFLIAALTLRNIGDFLTIGILTRTPIQVIMIIVLAAVAWGVKLGLEPIARAAEIFFPFVILLLFLLLLFVSPYLQLKNLEPFLENGIAPVLKGAFTLVSYPLLEPVVLLMIFPHVPKPKEAGQALWRGVLIGGMILFAVTLFSVSVLGVDIVKGHSFPSFELAKKINIGDFLQRIEALMMFIWIITIFFRLTILVYVISAGLAQTFNLKDYRMLSLPLCVILTVMALVIVPNSSYLLAFNQKIWPLYVYNFGLFFPLLLWIAGIVRRKGKCAARKDETG
ncbi:GerAB/ArcD/ProY family transporter [Brevibacillus massiliensis]|jgi:spore germination protein KB|uniref:GerAB/ArcD/ProY family transporter n=1 Tax=Brevibacillus massiliensis TaxID=1118054 RepID=UPI00030B9B76|nr:endospore germination permease [Brevibacillus massiliensis]